MRKSAGGKAGLVASNVRRTLVHFQAQEEKVEWFMIKRDIH